MSENFEYHRTWRPCRAGQNVALQRSVGRIPLPIALVLLLLPSLVHSATTPAPGFETAILHLEPYVQGNTGLYALDPRPKRLSPFANIQPRSGENSVTWTRIRYPILLAGGALLYVRDMELQRMVRRNRTSWTNTFARVATPFGDCRYMIPGLALLYFTGRAQDLPHYQRAARNGVRALALSTAMVLLLKYSLHRHRPRAGDGPYSWDGPRWSTRNTSFPSGHAATAFTLATVFAREFEDRPWVAPLLYSLATMTALARVHDNAHWMSDVFVGALVGHLTGRWVTRKLGKKKGLAIAPGLSGYRPLLLVIYGF